jgi:DNA polymerase-3 subunit epsilon
MVNTLLELIRGKQDASPDIAPETPVNAARYVVLDTELTGLDERADSIISMGAVRVAGGRILAGETFYLLVDPERSFKREGVVIHGITPSDVEQKPVIDEAIHELISFIGADVVVGHCISIDLAFINSELARITGKRIKNPAVDTYLIHEWLKKASATYRDLFSRSGESSLYEIAGGLGISSNGAHNAEMDAYITAQLFQRYIPLLAGAGIEKLGALLRVADPSKGGDKQDQTGFFNNF